MNNTQYIDIEYVKALMNLKGIDEKQMPMRMNVTLATVKRFLSGAEQRYMSGKFLYKLATALQVTAHSLIQKFITSMSDYDIRV